MTEVFNAYSRLELPRNRLRDVVLDEEIALPPAIESLRLAEERGKLHVKTTPADDTIGQYTPTAVLKGELRERTVVVNDDGTLTHDSVAEYKQNSGWLGLEEDENELEVETVQYVKFKGYGDDFLVHSTLREAMFAVACEIAEVATNGYVEGVLLEDGELSPVRVAAGGEDVDVSVMIERPDTVDDDGTGEDGERSETEMATQSIWNQPC